MSLSDVVEIYRKSNKPSLNDNGFIAVLPASREVITLIKNINNSKDKFEIEDITGSNGDDLEVSNLVESTTELTIEIDLGSKINHFPNLAYLVANCSSLKKGILPDEFYLFEEDIFYPTEGNDNSDIAKLKKLSILISSLPKLAHYHNVKDLTGEQQLVFLSGDKSDQPIVLEMEPVKSLLSGRFDDLAILNDLIIDDAQLTDTHHSAKVTIFSTTLKEFLQTTSDPKSNFTKLVMNWSDFTALFLNNLKTYSSGFAFNKAKNEIADTEIKFAEQLSNIMSDITGKLLSIPVSFAAIIAMTPKSNSTLMDCLIVFGLLITSVLIVGTVHNQQGRYNIVQQSKEIVFEAIQGASISFPTDLQTRINTMKTMTEKNIIKTSIWLIFFRTVAWLPCLLGAIFLVWKYNTPTSTLLLVCMLSALLLAMYHIAKKVANKKNSTNEETQC